MSPPSRRLAVLLALFLGTACGYRFGRPGASLPEGIHKVYAPLLQNRTQEPGVEGFFTQALRDELFRAGVDVGTAISADAVLEGELLELRATPTLLSGCEVLAGYRVFATAKLRLRQDSRVVSEAVVSSFEDYLPGGEFRLLDPDGGCGPRLAPSENPVLTSERNRELAVRHLAQTLMREGYLRIASSF